MDRDTILRSTGGDLRGLPLSTLEAFLLSQADGQLTLEEIAEIARLEFAVVARLAERLVRLGAASAEARTRPVTRPPRGKTRAPPPLEPGPRAARHDPRAESDSLRPPRHDPRAESRSVAPPPVGTKTGRRVTGRPSSSASERAGPGAHRSSREVSKVAGTTATSEAPHGATDRPPRARRSVRIASVTRPEDAEEPSELDQVTHADLLAFEVKLATHDHYALLGLERTADRRAVKNAYFALASRFHPDRFFRKKLGRARLVLERVFGQLTLAHDVLTDAARREEYHRTLPPEPARPSKAPPSTGRPSKAPPSTGRPSKAPPSTGRPSKAPAAAARASKAPPSAAPASSTPAARTLPLPSRSPVAVTSIAITRSTSPPTKAPATGPHPARAKELAITIAGGALRRPQGASMRPEVQRRVDVFVRAGDDAFKDKDVIAAANNYRLALQNSDDPALRAKLEMLEEPARMQRFELSFARARAAESEKRWPDAAFEYLRAHDARPSSECAERAAYALRVSGGDLSRAAKLAESAAAKSPNNVAYRLTLGEVYVAARRLDRAALEADKALALAPNDPRAKQLAAAIAKAR